MRNPLPWLERELPVLQERGLLQPAQAEGILAYYRTRAPEGANRLLIVLFGVLGSLLIGGGLLLIIAHNWSEWTRPVRAFLSVLPMMAAQGLSAFALLRRPASRAWHESLGIIWPLTILAAIALISQTYHMPGSIDRLLLVWSLLVLPICYLHRSITAVLLYLYASVSWMFSTGHGTLSPLWFWALLAGAMPLMILWNRRAPASGPAVLSRWAFMPVIFMAVGETLELRERDILTLYSLFAAVVWLAGARYEHNVRSLFQKPFTLTGGLSLALIAYGMSVSGHLGQQFRMDTMPWMVGAKGIVAWILLSILLAALAIYLRFAWIRRQHFALWWATVPVVHIVLRLLPDHGALDMATFLGANLYFFACGLVTLRSGIREDRLGRINAGMIMLCAIILARFFDANLPILMRALVFMAIGAGFLYVNVRMARKRREGAR